MIAQEHPGVFFASVISDLRVAMGQLGIDQELGSQGPLFRKWFDNSFVKSIPQAELKPWLSELTMLITALDEFRAGRVVEVGDILASRIRYITAGLEKKGSFKLSRHFLVYHTQDLSLVSDSLVDEALKIEDRDQKRQKRLAASGVVSGRY
jgi:hypothetical protein